MSLEGTSCLYSKCINTSGVAMHFPFLPPHGQLLQPNQEYVVIGDLTAAIAGGNGVDRSESMRALKAYEHCIASGLLQLLFTPAPIVQAPNGTVKMLGINNSNVVTVSDPCWKAAAGVSDSLFD